MIQMKSWEKGIFIFGVFLMVLTPLSNHFFLDRGIRIDHAWKMFAKRGKRLVHVQYYQLSEEGRFIPLDRHKIVEKSPKHIRSRKRALSVAKRLHKKLGRQAEIRMDARQINSEGWTVLSRKEDPLFSSSTRKNRGCS